MFLYDYRDLAIKRKINNNYNTSVKLKRLVIIYYHYCCYPCYTKVNFIFKQPGVRVLCRYFLFCYLLCIYTFHIIILLWECRHT